jgi:L-ascorbate 6-phosphate lactonase
MASWPFITSLLNMPRHKRPLGELYIGALGQAGFLISDGQTMIAIDPYLTDYAWEMTKGTPSESSRTYPAGLASEALHTIEAILSSHDHVDHLDIDMLNRIAGFSKEKQPLLICTGYCRDILERHAPDYMNVYYLRSHPERQDSIAIGDIQIEAMPAWHPDAQYDTEHGYRFQGFGIMMNGVRIYHAGDTLCTMKLVEVVTNYQPHVMFLPINGGTTFRAARGFAPNMSFLEAVDFAAHIQPELLIPMHYGLIPENDINPAMFVQYWLERGRNVPLQMLLPGQVTLFARVTAT